MDASRAPRHAERGQTLPVWTFAILTALSLMFFSLNYANVIRWQVRAQSAADASALALLSVQSTQWNKMTTILYSADVEEWRIRHLIEAMVDAGKGNGGCSPQPGNPGASGATCLQLYQALYPQYYKAVNRYTTDIKMLQTMSTNGRSSQAADVTTIIHNDKLTCYTSDPLTDCAFSYHVIDYSYRTTTQQAGRDAFYLQLGGFTSPQDSTPVADWEPARVEIATCARVQPLVSFSIFGMGPQPFTVIGRAAATNVTETAEWFAPGVTQIPGGGATVFQPAENYDAIDDTFAKTSAPRDWYQTNFPSINYTALPSVNNYDGLITEDFEVMVCWWAAIPYAPYTTAAQTQTGLCTQS